MLEFLGRITDILKSSLSFTVAAFLASVLIVVLPESTFEYLELDRFPINIRPWASLVCIICGSLITVQLIYKSYIFVNKHSRDNQEMEKRLKRLKSLTSEEKRQLAFYLLENKRSVNFPLYDGVSLQLEKDGILSRLVTTVSHNYGIMAGIPFSINDWAWDIILLHPDFVLEGHSLESYLEQRILSTTN